MLRFIHASQSYDGAFGMAPATESHGGCSYCAVAAMAMMGRLEQCPRTANGGTLELHRGEIPSGYVKVAIESIENHNF